MKGRISAGIFKVMAVVSALAIGGGYVAWRQSESENANKREHAESAKTEQKEEELMLMVGSKNPGRPVIGREMTKEEIDAFEVSYKDFLQPIPGIPTESEKVSNVVSLLPGSKSISMPVFTKDQIKKLQEKEKKEKPLKLLPGSKSINSLLDLSALLDQSRRDLVRGFPKEVLQEFARFDRKRHGHVLRIVELRPIPLVTKAADLLGDFFKIHCGANPAQSSAVDSRLSNGKRQQAADTHRSGD